MNYLLNSALSYTNYGILNKSNFFNFILVNFDLISDGKRKNYLDNIKIQIGNKFYNDFCSYIFLKTKDHEIIQFLK